MSTLADPDWVDLSTVVEEKLVRELIPRLYDAGARGIIELPINKIVDCVITSYSIHYTKLYEFVMWRPISSYREMQEKARRLLEDAGYWDRRGVEVRSYNFV